jgi:hypothetical protein
MSNTFDIYQSTEPELLNALAAARQYADLAMQDRPHGIMPQIHIYAVPYGRTKKELTIACVAGDFNGTEKGTLLFGMGRSLYETRQIPTHVLLLSEVFMSANMYEGERRKLLLPEDDPQRIEAVLVQLLTLDGRARINRRLVARDAESRLAWSGEWDFCEGQDFQANLLSRFFCGFADAAGFVPEPAGA